MRRREYGALGGNNVAGTSKALFLYHGAADDVTPVKHSDALAARLREKGWDVEYLRDPDAGHGFRDTVHEATVFSRMLDFFGKKINTSN